MRDVWVYASSRERAAGVRADLAELGYGARYLGPGQVLVPPVGDGTALGRPLLAVVVFGADGAVGPDLVDRMQASPQLSDVGVMLVVPAERLGDVRRSRARRPS